MSKALATSADVVTFWREAGPKRRFEKDFIFDQRIRERFLETHEAAADGKPLVTAEVLGWMKPGSILINTARSTLVEDTAVLDALNREHLAAYAVDAFDSEPPVLNELHRHPNTILTPHIGGFTAASTRRATELAVTNLLTRLGF